MVVGTRPCVVFFVNKSTYDCGMIIHSLPRPAKRYRPLLTLPLVLLSIKITLGFFRQRSECQV